MGVIKETRSLLAKHKSWSIAIKKRDNYACQKCSSNTSLIAHHINSWKNFPQERFDMNNGVTLCLICHKNLHKTWGKISIRENFLNFINNVVPIKKTKILLVGSICTDQTMVGKTFDRWTLINKFRIGKNYYCKCICECGNIGTPQLSSLKTNKSKNCGCLRNANLTKQIEDNNPTYKHGHAKKGKIIREYKIWADIKTRCLNKNSRVFEYYGGRGIKICDRWLNSFENFLEDMGFAPSLHHSIDRIEVNGNYEPSNCKWATKEEQANNTRSNRFITFNGKRQTYVKWERELGPRKGTVWQRKNSYGCTDEECLAPIVKRGNL